MANIGEKTTKAAWMAFLAVVAAFAAAAGQGRAPGGRAQIVWTKPICIEADRYIGWPSVCRLKNGDLIAVFSGDREWHICPYGKVQMVRSTDDGETWSAPETIANGPIDDRDAGIVQLPDGELLVVYFTSVAYRHPKILEQHPDYRKFDERLTDDVRMQSLGNFCVRSRDNGRTWTKPEKMSLVGQTPHGPILLRDGSLFQIGRSFSKSSVGGIAEEGRTLISAERSTDGGRTWQMLCESIPDTNGENDKPHMFHEPHVVELADGTLVGVVRYHGPDHCMRQTVSKDGGRTWTPMAKTTMLGLPPHLLRLADGRLVCVYGRRLADPGFGEFAAVSCDGGATWDTANEICLAPSHNGDLGYPASCILASGDILTVYYQQPRPGQKPCLMATRWRLSPPSADALASAELGDVRLGGFVGEKLARCIEARVYSDWADGPMHDEAVRAFRTHADDKDENAGWQNEYWGKTMLCTAGALAYTGDAALKAKALARAHAFVDEFQKPNGYLSTYEKEDFLGGATNGYGKWCFNVWGRKYTMWALVELHRATGDRKCLDAAAKMADHLIAQLDRLGKPIWKTGSWHGVSSMSILRPMNELYRLTGNERYRSFSEGIVRAMLDKSLEQGALLANASRAEPVRDWFPAPAFWAKAYEEMSCLEGAVDFSRFGTDARVLPAVEAFCRHLRGEELNPMRSVGHFDHFFGGGITFNGMTELCDVVHWIRLAREMLLVTGKADYADLMEEAFFNAFLAGVSRDGRWGAHVVRSHGTRHLWAPAQTGMTEHQCCPDNMMRAYFSFARTLAARAADGAVAVLNYADGETRLPGATVRVSGGYPYSDGPISVSVACDAAGKVRFRIPAWSRRGFLVDGAKAEAADGWCERVVPAGGAAFLLRFDMSPRICEVPANRERDSNGKPHADNPRDYTQHWMKALTPEMAGLFRTESASFVMRGPLVLAKGRFAGTSRDDTLFASTIRGQGRRADGWKAELTRLPCDASSAGVENRWRLVLSRGRARVEANVSDFASVSNVDDPSNWFSLWF